MNFPSRTCFYYWQKFYLKYWFMKVCLLLLFLCNCSFLAKSSIILIALKHSLSKFCCWAYFLRIRTLFKKSLVFTVSQESANKYTTSSRFIFSKLPWYWSPRHYPKNNDLLKQSWSIIAFSNSLKISILVWQGNWISTWHD